MAGRRQVWTGFTLFASSIALWSLAAGLSPPPGTTAGLGAVSLIAAAMLISLRAGQWIAAPPRIL
jgi:hypothetical protein